MFRQTPSGPTFTQTPLPCEPEDDPEPEPDWAGAVAGAVLAGAGAGAEVAGVLCPGVTWLGFAPPLRVVPPLVPPLHGGHAVEQVDRGPAAITLGGSV